MQQWHPHAELELLDEGRSDYYNYKPGSYCRSGRRFLGRGWTPCRAVGWIAHQPPPLGGPLGTTTPELRKM